MIKIENLTIHGIEEAIRGMRNPKDSWNKSDSYYEHNSVKSELHIGSNDATLMTALSKGGPVHAKYRRYIDVYVDITAPLYFWKEFDTYRVGVCPNPSDIEMNSCSTMHTVHKKPFELDDFSHEHLNDLDILKTTIYYLNHYRELFINTNDKNYWWQLIQYLPSSYMQKRTIKLNYEVLANMYEFRHNHKLDEWVELMQFFKDNCPCSEIFTTNPNLAHIQARNETVKKVCDDIFNRLIIGYQNALGKIVIKPDELENVLTAVTDIYTYKKE